MNILVARDEHRRLKIEQAKLRTMEMKMMWIMGRMKRHFMVLLFVTPVGYPLTISFFGQNRREAIEAN